ncbi:hypothetical protein LTR91_019005 [Friedmanniomyces endolithicus]|uniref:Tho complex subunit 7-domain-containing protein n=1 Tax=Friedmanniomyces endolithicus TaxID=329885 RepID=A0AAN6K2D6_9PEZI|nr:hypothetical protein LTR57_016206 [Friedmanniomyces endolithicus]KAK0956271.1 hypothetical protein LTS01_022936 [Friedmanniomyces endolithicus]KAK0963402.1 hypothetical protein LTR91_019005 [Friedmanniomyces endolithicus]KAK1030303.1 hypothetical protein LTS16_018961 [Friedmanniomyces endolithicus]
MLPFSREDGILATLGLVRSSISTREIELLRQAPIEQRDIIIQKLAMEHHHNYSILPEQSQEDALHATRLLGVEERPFQRVQRALLGKDSLLRSLPRQQLPSPPPEGEGTTPSDPSGEENFLRFRDEILLDFDALESSILRIQLIHSSNERERERYASEKAKILETAQAVRYNTVELRQQLVESQRVLELRKGYDELAAKILDDKKVKSREECTQEITTLEKEIEELEQESADCDTTWVGRREQFDRVVIEGEMMVRLIKGLKDEVEPEQMEGEEDQHTMEEGDDATRGESSRLGTPVPEGRTPMRVDDGGQTPMVSSAEVGDGTPVRPINRFLEVDDAVTRGSSRAASPVLQAVDPTADVEMAEALEVATEQQPLPEASTGVEALVKPAVEHAGGVPETMDEGP